MSENSLSPSPEVVEQVYRSDSRQVLATLIRLLGDFDTAEEALHDAFAVAVEQWAARWRAGQSARVARFDRPVQSHRWHAAARAIQCVTGGIRPATGNRASEAEEQVTRLSMTTG